MGIFLEHYGEERTPDGRPGKAWGRRHTHAAASWRSRESQGSCRLSTSDALPDRELARQRRPTRESTAVIWRLQAFFKTMRRYATGTGDRERRPRPQAKAPIPFAELT